MRPLPTLATLVAVTAAAVLSCTLFPAALVLLCCSYPLYRRCTNLLQGSFMALEAFFLERVYGIRLVASGAPIPRGASLIISNHRTRTDWMMIWPALARLGLLPDLHFMSKDALRSAPFFGWCMQACRHVFLRRRWEEDEAAMTAALLRLAAEPSEPYCLLMFPEGTDLSPTNLAKSLEFARKAGGLAAWQHVLHPRTRGFTHTLAVLRRAARPVDAVYDVTMAYAGAVPARETVLLSGDTPSAVHVHVDAFPVAALPRDDAGLEAWLRGRFAAKEEALGRFYAAEAARTGSGSLGPATAAAATPLPLGALALAAAAALWLSAVVASLVWCPGLSALCIGAGVATQLVVQGLCGGADGLERRVAPLEGPAPRASDDKAS